MPYYPAYEVTYAGPLIAVSISLVCVPPSVVCVCFFFLFILASTTEVIREHALSVKRNLSSRDRTWDTHYTLRRQLLESIFLASHRGTTVGQKHVTGMSIAPPRR